MRVLVLCLAAILATGTFSLAKGRSLFQSYEIEKSVCDMCNQGSLLHNSKNYREAIEVLARAVAYDPTSYSAFAHDTLADCLRALKEYSRARAEVELALKYDPEYKPALYTLALICYDTERFDEGLRYLRTYVKSLPDPGSIAKGRKLIKEISAFKNLREAARLLEADRYQDARRALEVAATFDPTR